MSSSIAPTARRCSSGIRTTRTRARGGTPSTVPAPRSGWTVRSSSTASSCTSTTSSATTPTRSRPGRASSRAWRRIRCSASTGSKTSRDTAGCSRRARLARPKGLAPRESLHDRGEVVETAADHHVADPELVAQSGELRDELVDGPDEHVRRLEELVGGQAGRLALVDLPEQLLGRLPRLVRDGGGAERRVRIELEVIEPRAGGLLHPAHLLACRLERAAPEAAGLRADTG